MNKAFFRQKGSAIIAVLIVSSILIASIFYIQTIRKSRTQVQNNATSQLTIQVLIFNIKSLLLNDSAWPVIRADPANLMQCLNSSFLGVCPTTNTLKKIFDAAGNLVFDLSSSSAGFDRFGNFCNTYGALIPQDTCQFKIQISWEPVCHSACKNPGMLQLKVDVFYNMSSSASLGAINTTKHSQELSRMATVP